jgi:hypothetical protein
MVVHPAVQAVPPHRAQPGRAVPVAGQLGQRLLDLPAVAPQERAQRLFTLRGVPELGDAGCRHPGVEVEAVRVGRGHPGEHGAAGHPVRQQGGAAQGVRAAAGEAGDGEPLPAEAVGDQAQRIDGVGHPAARPTGGTAVAGPVHGHRSDAGRGEPGTGVGPQQAGVGGAAQHEQRHAVLGTVQR